MFTGLIQGLGVIQAIETQGDGARFRIDCPELIPANWDLGASIAVAGCCLTALDIDATGFSADLSGESLAKTTHGSRRIGDALNLEPALRVGDHLGGHYVTGHVDGVAQVLAIQSLDAGNHRLEIQVPKGFERFVAPKGSVTLDGVSLTINDVEDQSDQVADQGTYFSVNIIPHTWAVTTLGSLKVGDGLNFEIDLLARYLDRLQAFSELKRASNEV